VIRLIRISKTCDGADLKGAALWGVSLEILRGAFVALRGPSGCGKSSPIASTPAPATPRVVRGGWRSDRPRPEKQAPIAARLLSLTSSRGILGFSNLAL